MFGGWKTVQQVAALPFLAATGGIEVCLVTSRERGRWILPKGWPKTGRSAARTAEEEAFEEAGLRGLIADAPVGRYRYTKQMDEGYAVQAGVLVFPMLVCEELLDWPERAQRRRAWHGLTEAATLVDDRELARLLSKLAGNDASRLSALAASLAASPAAGNADCGPAG